MTEPSAFAYVVREERPPVGPWILYFDEIGWPYALYLPAPGARVLLTVPAVWARPGGPGAVIEALNRVYAHV